MENSEITRRILEASKYIAENNRRGEASYIFIKDSGIKIFLFCYDCSYLIEDNMKTLDCPKCQSCNIIWLDESDLSPYREKSRLKKIDKLLGDE